MGTRTGLIGRRRWLAFVRCTSRTIFTCAVRAVAIGRTMRCGGFGRSNVRNGMDCAGYGPQCTRTITVTLCDSV
jgi:hypothetical protein